MRGVQYKGGAAWPDAGEYGSILCEDLGGNTSKEG